ncbi:hypothetical protein AVEN_239546-1 [Araneus ventricosus]|uniref:DDE-1 domain-containing protein n=1 Tax=Araneus ventricosus TaxID=182803 RepID=A0A4Y2HM31_ARAVE|nr:hypothetical protein AVEN_239546-1 [Araneus ventricosus]
MRNDFLLLPAQGQTDVIRYSIMKFFSALRVRMRAEITDPLQNSDSVLQLIKNVTIKDVIYWVSESWDNVTQNCLVKSRKRLWPSLVDSSKVEQAEVNKSEILPLIKCIPSCEDATEHTATEWLSCDTGDNQLYTNEEIVSLVQNEPQDDSDLEETDEAQNFLVSLSEAANALEIALRYIEKSENATSTDVMFMRRWHNIASTSRITSLRQTNLTNFQISSPQKIVNVNVYVMC